ncbi:zinc finger protein RFP-like isoform X3 [Anolis carolinensis]|uniref:zinc finger protein RFP-like isoform X3 n=1 Tax=Anolis carolinensis TaxID=28377 RepID=UPI002F2B3F2C
MAASGNPVEDFCQEATCSICLDYFKDPVTIVECGHNYCRACLAQSWGPLEQEASCPQCRAKAQPQQLIPNWLLANFMKLTKKLSLHGKEGLCQKHKEPLKLFCKEDQSPICMVCNLAKEHKDHDVVPAEEAAQEFKMRTRTEREQMIAGFRELHQFLKEQEKRLLIQLQEVEKEIERERE